MRGKSSHFDYHEPDLFTNLIYRLRGKDHERN